MGEFCNKCEKCRFKCKTSDSSKASKCIVNEAPKAQDYKVFFEENRVDISKFCKKNKLKSTFFNKMLKGEIPFDERYEYCVKKIIDKHNEFEPYRSKFEEVDSVVGCE